MVKIPKKMCEMLDDATDSELTTYFGEKNRLGKLTNVVIKQLRELGKTSASIAKKLLELKCKGAKSMPSDCPVANYLKKLNGGSFSVTGPYIRLRRSICVPVSSDEPVRDFMKHFDNGKYPELTKDFFKDS